MRIAKSIAFLISAAAFSLLAAGCNQQSNQCSTKESCMKDADCLCWCSQKCGWRKKSAADHPFYVDSDSYGKSCYCKKWDYDHYQENCVNGMNVKQPKGAK